MRAAFRKVFDPFAQMGDVVMLVTRSGALGGAADDGSQSVFWEVRYVEGISGLSPHGVLGLWAQSALPPPYQLDSAGQTGVIDANGGYKDVSPNALIFPQGNFDLLQVRILPRLIPATGGGFDNAVQDYEFQLFQPAGIAIGTLQNGLVGVVNNMQLAGPLGDSATAPDQGANIAATVGPAIDPVDAAYRTQRFIWQQTGMKIRIVNNGAANTAQAFGIGAELPSWRFVLAPISTRTAGPRTFDRFGKSYTVPADVNPAECYAVPISGNPD
jgi:hypothetical protein